MPEGQRSSGSRRDKPDRMWRVREICEKIVIVLQSQTTFGIIKASSGGMLTFKRLLFSQDGVSACEYRFVLSFCRVNNTSQRYSKEYKIVAED
jgi:hypothetical protein